MKKTTTKLLALFLAMALSLSLAACGSNTDTSAKTDKVTLPVTDGATIGDGATTITVEVMDADGKYITFTVNTDEETVGAALLSLGIIAGDTTEKQ